MTTENRIAVAIAIAIIAGLAWYQWTHPMRSSSRDGGAVVVDAGTRDGAR